MANIDIDWVKEQLTKNKTRKMIGDSVLKLLVTWEEIKEKTKEQKVNNSKEIVEIFYKLSLGHALVKEDKNEVWVQAHAGDLKVADYVRVRFNAFMDEKGKKYNGRRGRVVGVRYGDIIIKSNDNIFPILDGDHLKPEDLEKLVS